MDERDEHPESTPEVEDAFALLAEESRLAILRTLYAADEPLSFSDLRERVGIADSGQFNYHLGKLVGHFVEQTDEGYELRTGAERVVGSVFAGSYDAAGARVEPISLDGNCPSCGGSLAAVYADDLMQIVCRDCEMQVVTYPAPPGLVEGRDRAALPHVFSQYARTIRQQVVGGICPICLGPTAFDLDSIDEVELGLTYDCRRCGGDFSLTVGVAILDEPVFRAFAADHGVDLQNDPLWELDVVFQASERRLESGPGAVEFTTSIDDETLTVVLDETLSVVDSSRE